MIARKKDFNSLSPHVQSGYFSSLRQQAAGPPSPTYSGTPWSDCSSLCRTELFTEEERLTDSSEDGGSDPNLPLLTVEKALSKILQCAFCEVVLPVMNDQPENDEAEVRKYIDDLICKASLLDLEWAEGIIPQNARELNKALRPEGRIEGGEDKERLLSICHHVLSRLPKIRWGLVCELRDGKEISDLKEFVPYLLDDALIYYREFGRKQCLLLMTRSEDYECLVGIWEDPDVPEGLTDIMKQMWPYIPPSCALLISSSVPRTLTDVLVKEHLKKVFKIEVVKQMRSDDGCLTCIITKTDALKQMREIKFPKMKAFQVIWQEYLVGLDVPVGWTEAAICKAFQPFGEVTQASECMKKYALVTLQSPNRFPDVEIVTVDGNPIMFIASKVPNARFDQLLQTHGKRVRDNVIDQEKRKFEVALMKCKDVQEARSCIEAAAAGLAKNQVATAEPTASRVDAACFNEVLRGFETKAATLRQETAWKLATPFFSPFEPDEPISPIRSLAFGSIAEYAHAHLQKFKSLSVVSRRCVLPDDEVLQHIQVVKDEYFRQAECLPSFLVEREDFSKVCEEFVNGIRDHLSASLKDLKRSAIHSAFCAQWKCSAIEQLRSVQHSRLLLKQSFSDENKEKAINRLERAMLDAEFDRVDILDGMEQLQNKICLFDSECHSALSRLPTLLCRSMGSAKIGDIKALWKSATRCEADVLLIDEYFRIIPIDCTDLRLALQCWNEALNASRGSRICGKGFLLSTLPMRIHALPRWLSMMPSANASALIGEAFEKHGVDFESVTIEKGEATIMVTGLLSMVRTPKEIEVLDSNVLIAKGNCYFIDIPHPSWNIDQLGQELSSFVGLEHLTDVLLSNGDQVLVVVDETTRLPPRMLVCGTAVHPRLIQTEADLENDVADRLWKFDSLPEQYSSLETLGKNERDKLWDSHGFIEAYNRARSKRSQQDIFKLNVLAMRSTLDACLKCKCATETGETYVIPPLEPTRQCKPNPQRILPAAKFLNTFVSVEDADTLSAVEKLDGRVLALDFANASNPGGGWERGRMAQEEDMVRRTNVIFGLDKQFLNGSLGSKDSFYPILEFGSLLVKNVSILRKGASDGYRFQKPVLTDVLVAAAYDLNPNSSTKEMMRMLQYSGEKPEADAVSYTTEGFLRTFRKVYGIFWVAAEEGYETLVLGAFGCGAFWNPAPEMAVIMREAIQLFSGFFKRIVFAIPNNENDGNFQAFCDVLTPGTAYGGLLSRHYEPTIKNIPFLHFEDKPVCSDGVQCLKQDCADHRAQFCHPLPCPYGLCRLDSNVEHTKLFRHRSACPQGNKCRWYFAENVAVQSEHRFWFIHPKLCENANCDDMSETHRRESIHRPWCPRGMQCTLRDDAAHRGLFNHRKNTCEKGTHCILFGDQQHLADFDHPFLPPCNDVLPCCCPEMNEMDHCQLFSHICVKGAACDNLSDPNHLKGFIHLVDHTCQNTDCTFSSFGVHREAHLATAHHSRIPDIRPHCSGDCSRRHDKDHWKVHSQTLPKIPASRCYGHNTMAVKLTDGESSGTTFFGNRRRLQRSLQAYFTKLGKNPLRTTVEKVKEWMMSFRVVHRCSPSTLVKMFCTSFLMSLHCVETKTGDDAFCASLAMQHPVVQQMELRYPHCSTVLHALAQLVSREEFRKVRACTRTSSGSTPASAPEVRGVSSAASVPTDTKLGDEDKASLCTDLENEIVQKRESLCEYMRSDEVDNIVSTVKTFAASMLQLSVEGATGVNHARDREFETNKSVFGVFGPHTMNYGVVHLILKPDVIFHPDFYATPIAATLYASGHADEGRPWTKEEDMDANEEIDPYVRFFVEKLHPIDPKFFDVLALEYVARTSVLKNKPLDEVKFSDVKSWWMEANAHLVTEAHLPYTLPFSYVEKIVMHKTHYDSLDSSMRVEMESVLEKGTVVRVTSVGENADEEVCQRAYALTQAPISFPRAPSFVFHLFKESRAELPFSLESECGNWIDLRVDQLPFFVTLHVEGEERTKRLTIGFREDRTTYISPTLPEVRNPTILAQTDALNRHCCRLQGFHLRIRVNPTKKEIVIKHIGPSLITNRAKFRYHCKEMNLNFSKLCFWTLHQSVQIETKIALCKAEKTKSPLCKMANERRMVPVQARGPGSFGCDNGARADKGNIKTVSSGSLLVKFFSSLFGSSSPSSSDSKKPLAMCPKGLQCPLCYRVRLDDPRRVAHCQQFCHICLYGQYCNKCDDEDHLRHFQHMQKQVCPDGVERCGRLDDVSHRAEYHHEGLRDVLLRCREGQRCEEMRDPMHRQNFTHEFVHYSLSADNMLSWTIYDNPLPSDDEEEDHKEPINAADGAIAESRQAALVEMRMRQYRRTRAPAKKPVVDVAFSFDTTGSMKSFLFAVQNGLKGTLTSLYDRLKSKCILRLCIMAHGDYCDAKDPKSYLYKSSGFSNDIDALQKFVDACGKTDGGDFPECYELMLYLANHELAWETDTTSRVFVIIGDAEPHELAYYQAEKGKKDGLVCSPAPAEGIDWKSQAADLKKSGVTVHSVWCGKRAQHFWKELPKMADGECLPLSDANRMPELLTAIILKSSDEEEFGIFREANRGLGLDHLYDQLASNKK